MWKRAFSIAYRVSRSCATASGTNSAYSGSRLQHLAQHVGENSAVLQVRDLFRSIHARDGFKGFLVACGVARPYSNLSAWLELADAFDGVLLLTRQTERFGCFSLGKLQRQYAHTQ